MKKFKVKGSNWEDEYSLEEALEILSRYSLKRRLEDSSLVSLVVNASGDGTSLWFNSFYLLKDSGLDKDAEELRRKAKTQFNLDLTLESKSK